VEVLGSQISQGGRHDRGIDRSAQPAPRLRLTDERDQRRVKAVLLDLE
jgi:hypothetical protein